MDFYGFLEMNARNKAQKQMVCENVANIENTGIATA